MTASVHPTAMPHAGAHWRAICIWAGPEGLPSPLPGQTLAWRQPCAWSQTSDASPLPLPEPSSHRTLP